MHVLIVMLAAMCLAIVATTVVDWAYREVIEGELVCEHCQYSLVGLPAGAVCPECGRSTGSATQDPSQREE